MNLRTRLLRASGFDHMAHRPPLTPRFWVYCVVAFLLPVATQIVMAKHRTGYDELVWLVTLAPAFLLSLHYGMKGAVAGLLMGTALFIVVQLSLAINYTADDWRIIMPIYVAYGLLAISVGWLSQQLHDHYQEALENERLVAIGQMAVTIRHEMNNALTAIIAESHLLSELDDTLNEDQRDSARAIYDAAQRIAADVKKLANLTSAPVTEYDMGIQMLDLHGAEHKPST
jgi:signal transduction histidine kinase